MSVYVTSVEVVQPIGRATFPRCGAGLEGRALIVRSVDDGAVVGRFTPGTWLGANTRDDRGVLVDTIAPPASSEFGAHLFETAAALARVLR